MSSGWYFKNMTLSTSDIQVQDLNHYGIIAGIVDQIGLVEQINQIIGVHHHQIVTPGQAVKAMIINGLGMVSAPLYLFEKFFTGKATEHLLGTGICPEHLNDDCLGRVLDKLFEAGLTKVFITVALAAMQNMGVATNSLHLDSSSFHVDGKYAEYAEKTESTAIKIQYGYSRDHRPDLKQFIVDLICSGDGDVPLYLRVADGNESDSAIFAQILQEFRASWNIDALFVADAALYSRKNLLQMKSLRWLSRVPATLSDARQLLTIDESALIASEVEGYDLAECYSSYAGIRQRWLVVKSHARQEADLKQLEQRLAKNLDSAKTNLNKLCRHKFACQSDALQAARDFERQLKWYRLAELKVIERSQYHQAGRPRKNQTATQHYYQIEAILSPNQFAIALEKRRAGRFILATNVLDAKLITNSELLLEYKAQQSTERGFRFLKDPLFFTSSIFLKSPKRVAALAMVMGLCLLVYSIGQRALRNSLAQAQATVANQLGKPTAKPTLRWIFQCFMSIHLVRFAQVKQISNLTSERSHILQFFGSPCRKYYLLS